MTTLPVFMVHKGLKAIDWIATDGTKMIWLEVKNFRGDAAINRSRLSPQEPQEVVDCRMTCRQSEVKINRRKLFLADEVAKKVCDTLVGLMGGLRHAQTTLKPHAEVLGQGVPLQIVLFLHQDPELEDEKNFKPLARRLENKIEQQLSFLNVTVQVVNSLTLPKDAGWRWLPAETAEN